MRIALIAALVLLLAANIAATAMVLRSHVAPRRQKALQMALAWLVPLLGAVVVITFHWLDSRKQGPQTEGPAHNVADNYAGASGGHDHSP